MTRAPRRSIGAIASVLVPVLFLVLGVSSPAWALAGRLDKSFNGTGKVSMDFGGESGARAVAIQTDGKIVVAGWTSVVAVPRDFAVTRLNTDGSLDTTFGTGGKVTLDFGGSDVARAVVIQTDGKIVAGGCTNVNNDLALARWNADGTLDTTYGVGGKVITDLGGGEAIRSMVLQPDGKIVAAGVTTANPPLAPAFGGDSCADSTSPGDEPALPVHSSFGVVRYNTDGSLDSSFGTGGVVITSMQGGAEARGVALQGDGKVVVAGGQTVTANFVVARYNTDGTLDPTFGGGTGKVTTDLGNNDEARGLVIQGDGKIVLGGVTKSQTSGFQYFALARYNSDGTLDGTFGTGGIVISTQITPYAVARAIGLEPTGQLVLVGYTATTASDFIVARYQTDGTLDTEFGVNKGWSGCSFGSADGARAVAIQTDGKVVAAGYAQQQGFFHFGIARFLAS